MPQYIHENYCQEIWDLGRAIDKLNNFIRLEYWELCVPKELRCIYKFMKLNVCRFHLNSIDDDTQERDLFLRLYQGDFDSYYEFVDDNILQFPKRDILRNLIECILERLRDLNNWFDSPHGQNSNWWRVHDQFKKDVVMSFWNNNEIMNYIPDNEQQPL